MFKYKKLYRKAVATIEEKQNIIDNLSAASKEDLKKKVAAYQADIKRLKSALSRSDEQCEGCIFKGRTQKCGTCTRNPRAVDKFTK